MIMIGWAGRHISQIAECTMATAALFLGGVGATVYTSPDITHEHSMDKNVAFVETVGGNVQAFNQHGEDLWLKSLGNEITCTLLQDVDKDDNKEVLVGVGSADGEPGRLYFFAKDGGEFLPPQEVGYSSVDHIYIDDLNGDGNQEIICCCNDTKTTTSFPAKLLLYNSERGLLKEYPYPGYLYVAEAVDMTDDGYKEIIVGGTNMVLESTGRPSFSPTMFILDGKKFWDAPQSGVELLYSKGSYLDFPLKCFITGKSRIGPQEQYIEEIVIDPQGHPGCIRVVTNVGQYYDIRSDLKYVEGYGNLETRDFLSTIPLEERSREVKAVNKVEAWDKEVRHWQPLILSVYEEEKPQVIASPPTPEPKPRQKTWWQFWR